jgi:DNA (cytosine-5)-methyltransferase 1
MLSLHIANRQEDFRYDKQIKIMTEQEILTEIQTEVEELLKDNNPQKLVEYLSSTKSGPVANATYLPPTIADAIATIIENIPSNKYIFSIVITACLKKIMSPGQDIRIAQDNMPHGYSNRSLDQRQVTPFLKRHNYTHCEASGLESGRNLERPLPWDLNYQTNPRGRGNREAFLAVLHYVQEQNGDPKAVLKYMLYLDASTRETAEAVKQAPLEQSIAKIMRVFERHFLESSGQGKSRLPVLALYAIYESLVQEISRYDGTELVPLERHTTADLRSGSIGDIQVNKDGEPFEGVEVKSDKPITADMVNELPRKFNGRPISRYYILSTFPGSYKKEDEEFIVKAVAQVESTTGCQVIPNGLNRSLWYYMRLLSDPSKILSSYSILLNSDEDIRPEIIKAWNSIIESEY